MKRIKKITSHIGLSRFLAECQDTNREIPRTNIHTPYSYSPTHVVYNYKEQDVIICETSHKVYEVFAI